VDICNSSRHIYNLYWTGIVIYMVERRLEIQMEIKVSGYEAIEKKVKVSGNSGRIYVPVHWTNCRVKLIRLDPLESCD